MRSSGVSLRTLIVTALLAAQPVFPSSTAGAAGTLDASFGIGGRVVGGFYGWASAVALQPDGKIVAVGTTDVKSG